MDYQINNIYCVDSYEAIKEIPTGSIDLIVTDPPYKINGLKWHDSGVLKNRSRESSFVSHLEDKNLGDGIKPEILKEFVRVLKNINIYMV